MKWIEALPGLMPEDVLPHKKYKLWGKQREATDYVIVIREHREQPDSAKRVCIDGKWFWSNGDGISPITHWAAYKRPVPWDQKAHDEYIKEFRNKIKTAAKTY